MNKAEIDNGTIFYIIIAVIAAITSVLQKKKKPESHVPEPEPYEQPSNPWPEVVTERVDKQDVRSKYEQVMSPPTPNNVNTKSSSQSVEDNMWVDQEGIALTFNGNDIKVGEIGSQDESKKITKIDFDLRKAVIYSEIINRKY
jgi:hypothetical protein